MSRRRALMLQQAQGGWPSIYSRLNFVDTNGCSVLTDYYPNHLTKVDITFGKCILDGCIFGAQLNSTTDRFVLYAERTYIVAKTGANTGGQFPYAGGELEVVMENNRVRIIKSTESTYQWVGTPSWSCDYPLVFSGWNTGGTIANATSFTVCKIVISENDTIFHNLLPVLNETDNSVGFYDTITQNYLTNSSFKGGSPI